ncbi:MAG TPA: hypothetical protein P5205_21660 [Candidatus Paceibacterota bacterium]|nr:hypothetical protein [Candidatus Paceibacterota bacterium]
MLTKIQQHDEATGERLLAAEELLQAAWTTKSRPSIQWLRMHTGKEIPVIKIGRLNFYSLSQVRSALGVK